MIALFVRENAVSVFLRGRNGVPIEAVEEMLARFADRLEQRPRDSPAHWRSRRPRREDAGDQRRGPVELAADVELVAGRSGRLRRCAARPRGACPPKREEIGA